MAGKWYSESANECNEATVPKQGINSPLIIAVGPHNNDHAHHTRVGQQ